MSPPMVIVPAWFMKHRAVALGALSFFGQLALVVWYVGQAMAEQRLAYLGLGFFTFVGIVLLGAGIYRKDWSLLKTGGGTGVISWVVFGAQLAFPILFEFNVLLPTHVRMSFLIAAGVIAAQSGFLWGAARLEIRRSKQ